MCSSSAQGIPSLAATTGAQSPGPGLFRTKCSLVVPDGTRAGPQIFTLFRTLRYSTLRLTVVAVWRVGGCGYTEQTLWI